MLSVSRSHYHKMSIKRQDRAETRESYRPTSCGGSAPIFSYLSALIHHLLFCSSWVLILHLHIHLFLFFHPGLHPLHLFFSPSLWFTVIPNFLVPTRNCDPSVSVSLSYILFSHPITLLSSAPHWGDLCAVCRLPWFLQQSAQSGTPSALRLPRTPHRSHLWRACVPQQGAHEEPQSEPGAGHGPLPQQHR